MRSAKDIISLAKHSETLKRLVRTGWSLAGVNRIRPESVGEHSFGTALLSLLISFEMIREGLTVDIGKVTSIALLHDIPEALTSDIPQTAARLGGTTLSEGKRKAEREALHEIAGRSPVFKEWLENLWKDSETQASLESRIVTGADILDMLLHAVTLEESGISPLIVDQFFKSSHEKLGEYEIQIISDIFWELYQEHMLKARQMGIDIDRLERT